jgi:alkanesulfonate monooxygenase SsuD/methylene tetrahydromethanopterin reductase-like flavin-dependent oxidoreductase (luciferase family)
VARFRDINVGFGLRARSANGLLEDLQSAEQHGVDHVWLYDSGRCIDALVAMSYATCASRKLKIGVAVTNVVTRHPAVLANAIATVSNLSGGRVLCAVGRGDSAVRFLGAKPASIAELEKGFALVRALLGGETVMLADRPYRLPEPPQRRPLMLISADGPRSCRLAGTYADGAILSLAGSPELLERLISMIRSAASTAGRDPDDLYICAWLQGAVAETTEVAYGLAEPQVGRTLLAVLRAAERLAFPDIVDESSSPSGRQILALGMKQEDEYDVGGAITRAYGREFLHRFTVTGTPAECREKVVRIASIRGVSELAFNIHGPPGSFATFAEEVLPALRSSLSTSSAEETPAPTAG